MIRLIRSTSPELSSTDATLSEPGQPEYVDLHEISSNLFSVLRVNLLRGRAFLPEEDRQGAAPVMILGYSFWQRRFGGSPTVLDGSVVLDQKRYTVIGIAPAGFRQNDDEADVFVPLGQDTAQFLKSRGPHPIHVIARLHSSVTPRNAQAELAIDRASFVASVRQIPTPIALFSHRPCARSWRRALHALAAAGRG